MDSKWFSDVFFFVVFGFRLRSLKAGELLCWWDIGKFYFNSGDQVGVVNQPGRMMMMTNGEWFIVANRQINNFPLGNDLSNVNK